LGHITSGHLDAGARSFQPMNINYGLLPPLEAARQDENGRRPQRGERGRGRKQAMSQRALADLEAWTGNAIVG
jgi:methylenetetrahydrofolate--tRNA-(uracil-5-)-methyltransferase